MNLNAITPPTSPAIRTIEPPASPVASTPPGSPTMRYSSPPLSPVASSIGEPMCPDALPRASKCIKDKPYWQLLRSSGRVRRMYTAYTPEDVEEIDDPPFLMFLYRNYTYPPSYPQTPEEESYLNIMSLRSWDKLCR